MSNDEKNRKHTNLNTTQNLKHNNHRYNSFEFNHTCILQTIGHLM